MTILNFIKQQRVAFITCVFFIALSGCGGSGADSNAVPVITTPNQLQPATVTLLLTDAPSDDFDHIYVTISSVELLGNGNPVVLFDGDETIDLLMLENFADLFSISDDVPPGSYNKIRLRITDLELVRLDEDGNVVESVHPALPANGKIDLNPRGPIDIAPGENLVLQLDVDARRSIHISGNGSNRYRFRPVVFIDVIDDSFHGKAIRINGEIVALDASASTIEICQRRPSSSDRDTDDNDKHCVMVNTNDQTGYFDNGANDAAYADLMIGDTVMVIGMRSQDHGSIIDATIVAITTGGEFGRYQGTVQSTINSNNEFGLLLDSGQGFIPDTELSVGLSQRTGLADDDGNPLNTDAIQAEIEAEVDGLLVLSDTGPDVLRAIYVSLDIDSDSGMPDDDSDETSISGQVLTTDDSTNSLTIATDDGDRCLVLEDDSDIFLITTTADGSTTDSITLADVAVDALTDAYGEEQNDGCFEVDTLLVFN